MTFSLGIITSIISLFAVIISAAQAVWLNRLKRNEYKNYSDEDFGSNDSEKKTSGANAMRRLAKKLFISHCSQTESDRGEVLVGREAELSTVIDWIGIHKIIVVYGDSGTGKTEFCREVLKRTNTKYYIVNLINCKDFSQFIRRIADAMEIMVAFDDTPESIESMVLNRINGVLYLDAFENAIREKNVENADRDKIFDFLRKCMSVTSATVLISSRTTLQTDLSFKAINLGVLDDDSAVSLFMKLWKGEESEAIRDFVIDDLNKDPLAIVLTARQKGYVATIDELKDLWKKAKKNARVIDINSSRYMTVKTGLDIAYENLKSNDNARYLWELFTLFPETIDVSTAENIIPDFYIAGVILSDMGILYVNEKSLSMLSLIRDYIKETNEYKKDLTFLTKRVLHYYLKRFKVDRRSEMGLDKDQIAIESLTDALFFMTRMVDEEYTEVVCILHLLLRDYYMEKPYEAVEVVTKAAKQTNYVDEGIKANIIEYLGDLEIYTDKLEEAEEHYRNAEEIYRRIQDNLGLANVLLAMGDLYMRTDKLEEAEGYYREAEGLYRRIHDDLGLANVLKAMGDLDMRTAKLEEAEGHYREAEELYRRIKDNLGLANVLKAMGDLEMRTAKLEEAEDHYREAEELYRRIQDDLGLANVLLSLGDIETRIAKLEEAEGYYHEAKELYRRTRSSLGFANVLRALGNLYMRTDKLEEAECHYREAEGLYRRIKDNLGLASVLKAMGELAMRTDKLEEAECHYREAEELYRQIRFSLGLANVLLAMGDLYMRTDKLEEAEVCYREVKDLYRRIKDNLGLANVLRALGNLYMRTDKLEEAECHYREAKELYRRIKDDLGLANVLKSMGDLYMRTDKLEEAEGHYHEAEELYRRIKDNLGLANVLKSMGDLKMRTDKLEEAEGHYREAEELYRSTQDNEGLSEVLKSMGDLKKCTANLREAEKYYIEAEGICRRIHYDLELANILKAIGDLKQLYELYDQAIEAYENAVILFKKTRNNKGLAYASAELYCLYMNEGNKENAVKYFQVVRVLCERLPYKYVNDYCLRKIGLLSE